MAGKAKNTPHFPGVVVVVGGGGVGELVEWGIWSTLVVVVGGGGVGELVEWGIWSTLGGAKFFETSLPHFKTYFTPIGRALLSLDNNLKRLISIILLCLQCSLS